MKKIERVNSQIKQLVLGIEELLYDWANQTGIDKAVADQLVAPLVETTLEDETTNENVALQVTKLVKLRAKIVRFAILNRQLDQLLNSAVFSLTTLADWLSTNVFEEIVDLTHLSPPEIETTEWSRMPPEIPPSIRKEIERDKRNNREFGGSGFGRPL